jgi:hypothetical protein
LLDWQWMKRDQAQSGQCIREAGAVCTKRSVWRAQVWPLFPSISESAS